MKALVLTAGFGTRLRPLTLETPKPSVPFLGVPICLWVSEILQVCTTKDFVFNLHFLPELVRQTIKASPLANHAQFSEEVEKPLGSGGGLWAARSVLSQEINFFVANGDEVILPNNTQEWQDLVTDHIDNNRLATMAVVTHAEVGTKYGGVWCDEQNRVLGFGKQELPGAFRGYHNIGVYIVSSRIFDFLPSGESNLLYDAFRAGIDKGEIVAARQMACDWHETGQLADFALATTTVLQKAYGSGPQAHFIQRIWKHHGIAADMQNKTAGSAQFVSARKGLGHPVFIGVKIHGDIKQIRPASAPCVIDGFGYVTLEQANAALAKGGCHFLRKNGELLHLN